MDDGGQNGRLEMESLNLEENESQSGIKVERLL